MYSHDVKSDLKEPIATTPLKTDSRIMGTGGTVTSASGFSTPYTVPGNPAIQMYTDAQHQERYRQIWQENGADPNASNAALLNYNNSAGDELTAIEGWQAWLRSQGENADFEAAEGRVLSLRSRLTRYAKERGDQFHKVIQSAAENELHAFKSDSPLLDWLQNAASNRKFAYLAAGLVLKYTHAPKARWEAMRVLSAQLMDKGTARRIIDSKAMTVIVPRDERMTDLAEFAPLRGVRTFDGRSWETTRGVGGVTVGGVRYSAITEENLLGGAPDPAVVAQGEYPEGYSTTSHEFAHALQLDGLSTADKNIVVNAYNQKVNPDDVGDDATDQNAWVDGPLLNPRAPASWLSQLTWERDIVNRASDRRRRSYQCYASQNNMEFFAQLSNAYLGTNTGVEPTTGMNRNNGRNWIAVHESAEVLRLLDRLYGNSTVNDTNADGSLRQGGTRTNPAVP